jgi:hypothetical protein
MVNFKPRLRARELNLRKRFMAITAGEQVVIRNLVKVAVILLQRSKDKKESEGVRERCGVAGRLYFAMAANMYNEPAIHIPKPLRFEVSFDMFSDSNCWVFFKIRHCDLSRVFKCLRIPDAVKLSNGSPMSGVEVFLRALYELVSGEDQYNICENVFGREQSQQSRAFSWFINHVENYFYDILSDNLEWWKNEGFIENSRLAIAAKLESLGLHFEDDAPQAVAGFIDCNCLETSRVGGGPMSGRIK